MFSLRAARTRNGLAVHEAGLRADERTCVLAVAPSHENIAVSQWLQVPEIPGAAVLLDHRCGGSAGFSPNAGFTGFPLTRFCQTGVT